MSTGSFRTLTCSSLSQFVFIHHKSVVVDKTSLAIEEHH